MSHTFLKKVVNTTGGAMQIMELAPLEKQIPLLALLETELQPDPEIASIVDEIGAMRAMNPYNDPHYDPAEEWMALAWGM